MKNLPKAYNPQETEDKIYKFWEDNSMFSADINKSDDYFSIVIPPPNVTGVLHMGHALDGTIQDILIRYNRMLGKATLWLPGTDHAGIATQNVVEKKLREEGKSRFDLGREKFVETVWDWANDHKSKILNQFKRLGASLDRSRERFTLDDGCSEAVKEVFVNLYNKGLIYKGSYIVNWCPRCHSAISDIETEYLTEQGNLWEIAYPLDGEFGSIVIATTRPETMFGDVAVAVNPNDFKYKDYIGKEVIIPLSGRKIPVIADEAVEMGFGTGALKITPAHDPNDYEIGKRHGFSPIWIMDEEAKLVQDEDIVPYYLNGADRYDARKEIIKRLKEKALLIRVKEHEHNVGHCQRCNETVEPLLSEQWFVKMEPLVVDPIKAVNTGELNFIPERWTKIYLDWMENIRDWCISRQLWWGHQIPAYYCDECKEMIVAAQQPEKCTKCDSTNFTQDQDVLDTWFSSALWPFSTMGWPDKESLDFKKFYPTSTLVTGFDIIFFWVARMVVMGYEFTHQSPFRNVFIHGLVRDELGQKMSKSRGNTIDPVEIIDKYGSDALRFTLTSLVTYGGQDIKISDEKFEYGRNFANKIWNASRFVLMNLPEEGDADANKVYEEPIDMNSLTIADRWILSKYNNLVKDINKNISDFRPGEASQQLYEFLWSIYCDWYVEVAKTQLNNETQKINTQRILRYALERSLRLLHPIMPHLTEEIWQNIPGSYYKGDKQAIMLSEFPQADEKFEDNIAETNMNLVIDAIRGLRNLRQSLNIPVGKKINLQVYSQDIAEKDVIDLAQNYIKNMARVEEITISAEDITTLPPQSASAVVGALKLVVPLGGLIDVDKEIQRQKKKIDTLEKEKKSLDGRMNNAKFLENAPKDVIVQTRARIAEINSQLETIGELIQSLVR